MKRSRFSSSIDIAAILACIVARSSYHAALLEGEEVLRVDYPVSVGASSPVRSRVSAPVDDDVA